MPFVSVVKKPLAKGLKVDGLIDETLQAEMEAMAALYANAIRRTASAVDVAKKIMDAQARGTTADLRLFQEVLASEVTRGLAEALAEVSNGTRAQVLRDTERAIKRLPSGLSARVSFNNADPRAAAWARERAGSLIKGIEQEALIAVRKVISDALLSGGGVAVASARIRRVVGLHPRWQTAVEGFRAREVKRLLDNGMDAAEIADASLETVEIYAERLRSARALTIARTEVMAAQNMGQVLSWYQASDDGYLDMSLAVKEWVAGPSGWKSIEVCPVCMELDGQQVPVNGRFSNGDVMPPSHPNCRCTMNLIPLALLGDGRE
jgi:hypothetical protein